MVSTRRAGRGPADGSDAARGRLGARTGFTMIEVIVAVVILTFGLLGLAGTTAWVIRTSTMAEAQTERTLALQSVIERIRAQPFANVSAGSLNLGKFSASWTITASGAEYKTLEIVTTGPGMSGGGSGLPSMSNNVADTFVYQVLNP